MDNMIVVDPECTLKSVLDLDWPTAHHPGRPQDVVFVEDLDEGTARNAYRASRALLALKSYALGARSNPEELNESVEQVIRDLLSDLQHLCDLFPDSYDYGFHDLVDRALWMHNDEVKEP